MLTLQSDEQNDTRHDAPSKVICIPYDPFQALDIDVGTHYNISELRRAKIQAETNRHATLVQARTEEYFPPWRK